MSIYQFKGTSTYRYRFQFKKKVYTGVCYGCETVHECIAYETKIKAAVMRLAEQKTIHELYENCRDMLIQREAISLESALDLALAKPMRKRPCERRLKAIRKVWGDFAYFMQKMYPGEQFVQSVTPAIAEQYIGLIRAHGNFEDFYNQRDSGRYSITTANIIHTTLIQIYNLLKNDTGMVENPFKSIKKLPQNTQSHEPYTVDELRTIFQHADDYIKPLFMIGLFSGMRLGDICTINKKDIQFDRHFIIKRMRKTSHVTSVPMHEILERYLREIYDKHPDSEYLLPEHAAQYLKNPTVISQKVGAFLESIGIVCNERGKGKNKINLKGIHSLRHTFCTIAGVVGIPETVVRSIVGHMTPRMTELYTRHIEEGVKLEYIKLFGNGVGEYTNLPLPKSKEEIIQEERIERRLEKIAQRGGERDIACSIIRRMPIEDVRYLLLEWEKKYPFHKSAVQVRGMA